eukprot:scaffold17604_cov53-Phaeocystis_antarctica.AAC.2
MYGPNPNPNPNPDPSPNPLTLTRTCPPPAGRMPTWASYSARPSCTCRSTITRPATCGPEAGEAALEVAFKATAPRSATTAAPHEQTTGGNQDAPPVHLLPRSHPPVAHA